MIMTMIMIMIIIIIMIMMMMIIIIIMSLTSNRSILESWFTVAMLNPVSMSTDKKIKKLLFCICSSNKSFLVENILRINSSISIKKKACKVLAKNCKETWLCRTYRYMNKLKDIIITIIIVMRIKIKRNFFDEDGLEQRRQDSISVFVNKDK